jgi:hypothetical protein
VRRNMQNRSESVIVQSPAWQAALAEGLDMSLVELSLEKTAWERLVEHDEALEFAEKLRKAGAKLYEQA